MRTLLLLAGACCGACAAATPPRPDWQSTGATFRAPSGFSVELPARWVRLELPKFPSDLVLSRDGVVLNYVLVTSEEPGQPFLIGDSKRAVTAQMTPQEAAEAVADGLQSAKGWGALEVLESTPVQLAGRDGFRILARYHDPEGLGRRIAICGLVTPTGLYYLLYVAPERAWFARELPAFEALVASFQLRPGAVGVPHRERAGAPGSAPGGSPGPAD